MMVLVIAKNPPTLIIRNLRDIPEMTLSLKTTQMTLPGVIMTPNDLRPPTLHDTLRQLRNDLRR